MDMGLEELLERKCAVYASKCYGVCDEMRDTDKSNWPILIKNCCLETCDKYADCSIVKAFEAYFDGMVNMMTYLKPIVMEKVVIDLVEGESPYNDFSLEL